VASFFGLEMPIPGMDTDTEVFWENCKKHKLTVQRCVQCGTYRFAPTPVCYVCQSPKHEWIESQGIGEVYTWTIVHHAVHPAVTKALPYNVTVVRLLDCGGAKLLTNLVGTRNEEIKPGMRVRVEWDEVTREITLPRFRPI
jgi:uncharacterized OB-fold protein